MAKHKQTEEAHLSRASIDWTSLWFVISQPFRGTSQLGEQLEARMALGYQTWGMISSSLVTIQGFSINSVCLALRYQILPIANYTMGSQCSFVRLEYFSLLGKQSAPLYKYPLSQLRALLLSTNSLGEENAQGRLHSSLNVKLFGPVSAPRAALQTQPPPPF